VKVVIDTNIFISGIFWSGTPHEVLNLWIQNKFKVIFTLEMLDECFRVLKEFGFNKDPSLAEEWIVFISKNVVIVDKIFNFDLCRDKDDNKFINCALSGKANYIVTGDKDLLDLKKINEIKIITPKQLLILINSN
jgi:uncharacterized protein